MSNISSLNIQFLANFLFSIIYNNEIMFFITLVDQYFILSLTFQYTNSKKIIYDDYYFFKFNISPI